MWAVGLKAVPTWCWALLAGLLLAGLVGGAQQLRVLGLQGDLKAERSARIEDVGKLSACRVTRSNLLEQAIDQNRAVATLHQAATDRAAVARAGQASARSGAEKDYQAANRLQQERTGGDACAAAEAVIDQELGL